MRNRREHEVTNEAREKGRLTLRPKRCGRVAYFLEVGPEKRKTSTEVTPPAFWSSPVYGATYLRAELISENSAERRVPRLVRTVTSAIAINDAISAYSMAVAPDSSDAKSFTNFMTECSNGQDGFAVAVPLMAPSL